MNPIIQFKNTSFAYQTGPLVLEDIDLDIEKGEFLGIVGPNGSGKTTLLKLIMGLAKPTAGTVQVFNKHPEQARNAIGYVPQFATFPRDFPISVEQTVLMGRLGKTRWVGGYTQKDKQLAMSALEALDVMHLNKKTIGELSGGQLQRVLIARALVSEPDILLLDEPTASVDPGAEENIFDLLKKINKDITIIVVSHDLGFISHYIERVACVNKTLVCHTTAELTPDMLENLYGSAVHAIHHHHQE